VAIEGPVEELAISDLLQLLLLSRRTGRLTVTGPVAGQTITLALALGNLVGARRSGSECRLGALLLRSGAITERQLERALERQRAEPGRPLGEILAVQEGVSQRAIRTQLRYQVESAVFDLVRAPEGYLRFVEGDPTLGGGIEIRLATDSILHDAVRRADEWSAVMAGALDPDPVPRLAHLAGPPGLAISLGPLEWELLAEVDGVRPISAIARSVGQDGVEVARAFARLVGASVLEFVENPRGAEGGGEGVGSRSGEGGGEGVGARSGEGGGARVDARSGEGGGTRAGAGLGEGVGAGLGAGLGATTAALPPASPLMLARERALAGDLSGARAALSGDASRPDPSPPRREVVEKVLAALEQVQIALEDYSE